MHKLVASIVVAGTVGASVFAGAVAPASAASLGDTFNLWNYVLTIKGSQLQSAMGSAANAAWNTQTAQRAAAMASYSSVGQINGLVDFDHMAEVIPIKENKYAVGAGGRLLGPVRLPAFGVQDFLKVTPGAATAATVGVTAFAFRGDFANGVLGWFGVDSNAAVCASPVFGQSGSFANFLTGQDCSLFGLSAGYNPNADVVTAPAGHRNPGYQWPPANGDPLLYRSAYLRMIYDPATPRGIDLVLTTIRAGSAGVSVAPNLYCQNTSTQAVSLASAISFPTYAAQSFQVDTVHRDCPVGSVPYSVKYADPRPTTARPWDPGDGAVRTEWYRPGTTNAAPYAAVEADPLRTLVCEVTGSDGQVRSGTTGSFRESAGAMPMPNCPTLPAGVYPTRTKVSETGGNGTQVLYDQPADAGFLDWQANEAGHCSNRDCVLDLIYVPTGQSCFGMSDACNGWMVSPTRDADYQCQYGGRAKPIQECYVYAQVFDPQKRLDGQPYADPKTGDELGSTSGLRYDQQLMGRPGQDPALARACGGSSDFSLNPLDFVLRPIQCALEWAFSPRPAVVNGYGSQLQDDLNARAPGQLAAVVGSWAIAPVMTGCRIEFTHWETGQPIPIVDACSGPMAALALVSRTVTTLAMIVLAVVLIRRQVSGVVDFKGN